jgi:NADH dehydrogenase [ubiquinone] 1 alpha subcomplex assembly factor 7
MDKLSHKIKSNIRREGPITLATFMQICLFDEQYGYYRHQLAVGKDGDFITAPEISQIFNEIIAFWLIDSWHKLGEPKILNLLELGPGRGTLLYHIWRVSNLRPSFQQALRIHIVEKNQSLQLLQQNILKELPVFWHNQLPDFRDQVLLIVGNEFFDVFPIHQYQKTARGWFERAVSIDESGNLCWVLQPAGLPTMILSNLSYPNETIVEYSPSGHGYMAALSSLMRKNQSAALIIDYGRWGMVGPSLHALKQHKSVDPLIFPGLCDMTALVDFSMIDQVAKSHQLVSWGPIPQPEWLINMGFNQRMSMLLATANAAQRDTLLRAADWLLSPQKMGKNFQAMAISSEADFSPAGFVGGVPQS